MPLLAALRAGCIIIEAMRQLDVIVVMESILQAPPFAVNCAHMCLGAGAGRGLIPRAIAIWVVPTREAPTILIPVEATCEVRFKEVLFPWVSPQE